MAYFIQLFDEKSYTSLTCFYLFNRPNVTYVYALYKNLILYVVTSGINIRLYPMKVSLSLKMSIQ